MAHKLGRGDGRDGPPIARVLREEVAITLLAARLDGMERAEVAREGALRDVVPHLGQFEDEEFLCVGFLSAENQAESLKSFFAFCHGGGCAGPLWARGYTAKVWIYFRRQGGSFVKNAKRCLPWRRNKVTIQVKVVRSSHKNPVATDKTKT